MASHNTQQHLFSNPCSDKVNLEGGTDAATRNSMSVELLVNNGPTGQGVVNPTINGGSTYSNGPTFRNITLTDDGSAVIRICGLNSSESGLCHDALAQHFLPTSVFQSTQPITEYVHVIENTNGSEAVMTLSKTENFLTWLNSSIDRLHDMREFEPGSAVRALLYINFMQDFIALDDELVDSYLSLLSQFLGRAHSDRPDFWGTVQSGNGQRRAITFEEYVRNGGPLLELDDRYRFPSLPKNMNTEKKILMNRLVVEFKACGIPLIGIVDNTGAQANVQELRVQSISNIEIADDGGSLSIGTLRSLTNVTPDQIKKLFLHFRGLTSKDQKYANIDGVNILLLLDAFKHSIPHQNSVFETTAKSFIASIDRANAKKWTDEKDENIQKINQEALSFLLPQGENDARTFTFKRFDKTHQQTEQTAHVQQVAQKLNENKLLNSIYHAIIIEQQKLVSNFNERGLHHLLERGETIDFSMRCGALQRMFAVEQHLRSIVTLPYQDRTIKKKEYDDIKKEQNKLARMLRVRGVDFGPLPTASYKKDETYLKDTQRTFLVPIAEKILSTLPQIIRIEKEQIPPAFEILRNFNDVNPNCPFFYLVEVEENPEGEIIIKTPTGSYQPLICLGAFGIKDDFIMRINGKLFIPLLVVQKLEQIILNIISENTVEALIVTNQDVQLGRGLDQIIEYIKTNAYSLTFLNKDIQTAFLEEVSHIELGKYDGSGAQDTAKVHSRVGAEKTATVAGHIFEPGEHVGLVKHIDDDGESIDRIENAERGIAQRITEMTPQEILRGILIASMSVGKRTGQTMDVVSEEDGGAEEMKTVANTDESIFITIDKAIAICIAKLKVIFSELYPQTALQLGINSQLDNIKNILTGDEMFSLIVEMCRENKDFGVVPFLDEQLSERITGRVINMLANVFQQQLTHENEGRMIAGIHETLNDLLSKKLGNKTIGEFCTNLRPSHTEETDIELGKEWSQYLTTHVHSHSTEDDPFEEVESSWFFGRRFLNQVEDTKNELPLLAIIINHVNSENSKPDVILTSEIFPNDRFTPYVGQNVSVNFTGKVGVSVAQVHRESFNYYKDFLFGLVRQNGTWKNAREGNLIFSLWYKRLIHDEGVPPMADKRARELFREVVSHHVRRIKDTDGAPKGNSAGDDDEAEAGSIKLHEITSSKKIGFHRSLTGISGTAVSQDKAQRCLHFTIKSLAYSSIPSVLDIGPPMAWRRQNTQQAAIKFCCVIRAYEGLKSAGDLLPLLVARSMNLCYSFQRQRGDPETSIFGGATFDKLCTMSAHLHQVPSVMIDINGGVLCFGGFRGQVFPDSNVVLLNNDRTLVAQLDLQLASCDTYWIGQQNKLLKRTLHFLVLLLVQVIFVVKRDQGSYNTFVDTYGQIINGSNKQIIDFIEQMMNMVITDGNSRYEFIDALNSLATGIRNYNNRLLPTLLYRCSNRDEIIRRAQLQEQIREQTINMLLQFLQNTNQQFTSSYFLNILLQQFNQPQPPQQQLGMTGQQLYYRGMAPRLPVVQAQVPVVQAQVPVVQAQVPQQQQMMMGQPSQQQVDLATQHVVPSPVQSLLQQTELLMQETQSILYRLTGNLPRSEKRGLRARLSELVSELQSSREQLSQIAKGRGPQKKMALESRYRELGDLIRKITQGSQLQGGSRKRRHRRRKTRRKKKKRKKKTIKRRRKRGRKTRRK